MILAPLKPTSGVKCHAEVYCAVLCVQCYAEVYYANLKFTVHNVLLSLF